MSFCREMGKDKIIFVTKEDHEVPCTIQLNNHEDNEAKGIILENGEINWNCPCLGGLATGPCGVQFRDAFTCFHYSKAEPKGSDCYEQFQEMRNCMTRFPNLYPSETSKEELAPSEFDEDFNEKVEPVSSNSKSEISDKNIKN